MTSAKTAHSNLWPATPNPAQRGRSHSTGPEPPTHQKSRTGHRDQRWLEQQLQSIWQDHFHDVERHHPLKIVFGRPAKTRLGSIRFDKSARHALIRVNGLFRDSAIPYVIVKATIVHELSHYAHGFHSGLTQLHRYPHAGGVVRREFEERGLGQLYDQQREWLKANWPRVVKKYF